jgi:hypothetical protein
MPPTRSWFRVSLFTKVTRCPTAIVISSGESPVGVIVTVVDPLGDGEGDGGGVGVGDGVGGVATGVGADGW